MTILTKHFPDCNFVVAATVHGHYVEFCTYEADGYEAGDDLEHFFAENDVYLHGSVKWDGCSNWWFDEQARNVMLHACDRDGPSGVMRFGEVMAACWDWTSELLPTWDKTIAKRASLHR